MRLYIAGPMSGREDFNFPLFFQAASILQSIGYETENPADNDGDTLEESLANARKHGEVGPSNFGVWSSYLKRDLPRVCKCDGVVVLPDWQNSRGATLEVDVAERLGMPVYTLLHDGDEVCDGPCGGWKLVPRIRAIGLSGYARTGKDTVAKILVEDYGYVQGSFAAKLKELAEKIDPLIEEWEDQYEPSNYGVSFLYDSLAAYDGWEGLKDAVPESRRFLQALGTGVREVIGQDTWVRLALRSLPDGSRVVFSDCRFPNEAGAIKAAGGSVWRIERPGYGPVNGHISEVALDGYGFDVRITNAGTLDMLSSAVRYAMDGLRDAA